MLTLSFYKKQSSRGHEFEHIESSDTIFFSVMNNLLYTCYAIGNTWLIHNEFQGVIQVLCDTGVLP